MKTIEQFTKEADSPDASFEKALFQLAYDKLQGKLFNLLPFLVGFEIVNKAPDGTKAVGVFGFKSDNGQILYVPAFFINGKVKDLDVMYSRNNNQFYPLNEDFASLFLKDDATGLGSMSDQSRKEIERQNNSIDMRDMVYPPRTGRTAYASVIDFISDGDDNIKSAAWTVMRESPEFTEALNRFYTPDELAAALVPNEKVAAQSEVEIVTPDNAPVELKPKAMTNGFAVIDRRKDDKKTRYGLVSYTNKFTNPSEPGFYSYLTELGTIRYGLVLMPYSLYANFRDDKQLVIDLQAEKPGRAYLLYDGKQVFIREAIKVADYSAVHKLMENPVEGDPSFSKTYILINESLKSTEPFQIRMNYTDDRKMRRMKVDPGSWDSCCQEYKNGDERRWPKSNQFNPKAENHHPITLVFTKRESDTLEYRGNTIYVPKGFKLLEIHTNIFIAPYEPGLSKKERESAETKRIDEENEFKAGRPGRICDLTSLLMENGVMSFSLRSNGSEYFANVGRASKKYSDPLEAKIGMVLDFGLDEEDSAELISGVSELHPTEGYFKYAVTGEFVHSLFDEPESSNELGQPTTYGIPYQAVAPTDHHYQGDPTQRGLAVTGGPDQSSWGDNVTKQEGQRAAQLAAGGQKEIFDTSAIAMISKYVDPTSKVVAYLPNFVDTLDKLGRMLFMIYWDTEKFHKMYGTDELPELLELVKNVFRNLGDLVIFLKRKFPDISINVSEQDVTEGG